MLMLKYPIQVGAVRVEGVTAAAVDGTANGRRFGNLAVAHLAADHAAGRVLYNQNEISFLG